jgi:hypothetical protein
MMPVFFRPLLRDSAKLNTRTVLHSRRAVKDYACPFSVFIPELRSIQATKCVVSTAKIIDILCANVGALT